MTVHAINYPKRDSHFAHKTFRLMHKASVAAEIGRDAFCLVAVVLHTEDAARYRGPVRFWNSQLIETLGFSKWQTFDKARAKAVSSGWLNYSGDGKRSPGVYFVTIPNGFEAITDAPMEEVLYTELAYKEAYDRGYKDGYNAGINREINGTQSGMRSGDDRGEPYYPSPLPSPDPKPKPEESILLEISEDVRPSAALWIQYKIEKGQRYKATGLKMLASRINRVAQERGATAVADAIEKSMASNWQGWENGLPPLTAADLPRASRVATDEDLKNWKPTGMFSE